MSFVRVIIHAVWGTKSKAPFLTQDVRSKILSHIKENAHQKQIYIDTINGHVDHIHCLFGLNADMSIAKALHLMKGESSHWINKNGLTKSKFEWADEYYANSVCEDSIFNVRRYIQNQEDHHKRISFTDECNSLFGRYSSQPPGQG